MAKTKSSRWGIGCALLFALPFAGVGAFMGYRFVSSILTWRDAAGWVETTAQIDSLELERHRGKDSTSYQVVAEYTYQYDGSAYHGDRVGLFSGSDNVGDYHRMTHARLKSLRKRKQPIPCYVDPDNPQQALLDRQMRLGLLTFHAPFVVGFGAVGFGMLGWAAAGVWKQGSAKELAKLHPDEPWRWKPEWESGLVRSSGVGKMAAWMLVALLWNATCGTLLAVAFAMESPGLTIFWVIVGLNLLGAVLLLYALFLFWRHLRYGTSELQLASVPGVIGGNLTGVVTLPARVPDEEGFNTKLLCQRQTTTRSGGESNTTIVTVWEDERLIGKTLDSGDPSKTAVPVMFTIPSDATATDPEAGAPVSWKLKITAAAPGPDYLAEFEVPVFLTKDSRDGVTREDQPLTEYEAEPPLAALLGRERIRLEDRGQWDLRVTAPPLRNPLGALSAGLFTAVLYVVAVVMFTQGMLIFPIILSLVGLIGLFITGESALNSSQLTIDGDRWTAASGWYGFRKTRRFHAGDIRKISLKQVMTSSSGSGDSKKWNHLRAKLKDGDKVILVHYLENRLAERKLLAELNRQAGLDRGGDARKDDASGQWGDVMDLPAEE